MTTSLIRPGIELSEYQARRQRVLKALNGSAALVLAGEHSGHADFKPDSHFAYLTGITTEPGAAVLFNPAAEDPHRRISLFLRPLDPEADRWDRHREMLSLGLKAAAGFTFAMRTTALPGQLALAARRTKKLACLHPFSSYTGGVSPDLAIFRKVQERTAGVAIEDRTLLLNEMRSVKSAAELELMGKAAKATATGYTAVLRSLRPGANESTVARTLESEYIDAGAEGVAYGSICGTGFNATILHYRDNNAVCRSGELLLIDSGAKFQGYACDVTRTIPVSGKFTDEQRELYALVLKAQKAALRAIKPGAFIWQIDRLAHDIIEKAGLGDAFMHSTCHHLGIDVHDATPDGSLKPGMVITVEPGVYLPEKKIGIRIEDSVVVTARGIKNLTDSIPKEIADIERAMRR